MILPNKLSAAVNEKQCGVRGRDRRRWFRSSSALTVSEPFQICAKCLTHINPHVRRDQDYPSLPDPTTLPSPTSKPHIYLTSNNMNSSKEARPVKRVHWVDDPRSGARTPSPVWSDTSLPESSAPYTPPTTTIQLPRIPSNVPINVHKLLQYQPNSRASTPIMYDVTLHPALATSGPIASASWEPIPDAVLLQPATYPPVSYMEVSIPGLPWRPAQVVPAVPGRGITVAELLHTVYRYLRLPISPKEFEYLPPQLRERVEAAFNLRCSKVSAGGNASAERLAEAREYEHRKGKKRVDCLTGRTNFVGLSRHTKEIWQWQLHLSS